MSKSLKKILTLILLSPALFYPLALSGVEEEGSEEAGRICSAYLDNYVFFTNRLSLIGGLIGMMCVLAFHARAAKKCAANYNGGGYSGMDLWFVPLSAGMVCMTLSSLLPFWAGYAMCENFKTQVDIVDWVLWFIIGAAVCFVPPAYQAIVGKNRA